MEKTITKKGHTEGSAKTKPNKANFQGFLIAVYCTALYNMVKERDFLKSKYGGEWLRLDSGEIGCMSRTPVGLANHPALNLNGNYQLRMAA